MSQAPQIEDPLIGQVLNDRYAIERVVGQEHLGRVYAGRDRLGKRPVHLKVLRPDFVNNAKRFARFGREITATWLVSHPNTVEVLDWGQQGHVHFLVMEPLEGQTLEAELASGPLPLDQVAVILAQVASALGAAHQEGIVHRALSPRNVFLMGTGEDGASASGVNIKIRDFGMSKLETIEEGMDMVTATATMTIATMMDDIAYMAPEFLNTGQFIKKSDLYSLGAVGFHMLTGEAPPEGTKEKPAPSSLVEGIPEWMDELIADLLATDPQLRPGAYRIVQRLEAGMGRPLEPRRVFGSSEALVTQEGGEDEKYSYAMIAGVIFFLGALLVGGAAIVSSGILLLALIWVAI